MNSVIHGFLNLAALGLFYLWGGDGIGIASYIVFNVFHILYLTLKLDDD